MFFAISVLLVFALLLARLAEAYLMDWLYGTPLPFLALHHRHRHHRRSAGGAYVLPTGRRSFRPSCPASASPLVAWVVGSMIFGAYIDNFSSYASTYDLPRS